MVSIILNYAAPGWWWGTSTNITTSASQTATMSYCNPTSYEGRHTSHHYPRLMTDAEKAQAHAYWRPWNKPAPVADGKDEYLGDRRVPRRLFGESPKVARRSKRRRFQQQLRASA